MDGNESSGSKQPSVGRVDWARHENVISFPAAPEQPRSESDPPVTLASQAKKIDQLQQALITRDLIGQAKGILMERHRITADQAFSMLVRASQHSNIKLISVVGRLVHTGSLDGDPRSGARPT